MNPICDILANDDDFYISDVKERTLNKRECTQFLYELPAHSLSKTSIEILRRLCQELQQSEYFYCVPMFRVRAVAKLRKCIHGYRNGTYNNSSKTKSGKSENESNASVESEDMLDAGTLRILFSSKNVYCPVNELEFEVLKLFLFGKKSKETDYNSIVDESESGSKSGTKSSIINRRHFRDQQSVLIIKPQAANEYGNLIRATLVGNGYEILQCKAEKYSVLQLKQIWIDPYYNTKNVCSHVIEYLASAPIVVMVIRPSYDGSDSYDRLKHIIGHTDPNIDRKMDEETQSIRGCFGEDLIHNAVDITLSNKAFNNNLYILFYAHEKDFKFNQ